MISPLSRPFLSALFVAVLAGCGGGGSDTKGSAGSPAGPSPAPAPGPIAGVAEFTVAGTVATTRGVSGAYVQAYDTSGKACGVAVSGIDGRFSLPAKCAFPVVLTADTPDGNDAPSRDPSVKGEGRSVYTFIPSISSAGQTVSADITPLTSIVTNLALGRVPSPGAANPKSALNETRRDDALAKLRDTLSPFLDAVGAKSVDLMSSAYGAGDPLRRLFQLVRISFERVESTKQTYFRFFAASEHRPIVLVATDGRPVSEAFVDAGLGMAVADVDAARLSRSLQLVDEIVSAIEGHSSKSVRFDECFLHNASRSAYALFDMPPGWLPDFDAAFERVDVLRLNTYSDFTNETLEQINPGPADLAFVSYQFRNAHGLKQRAYVWLIRGSQPVNGCSSSEAVSGPGWRVLGNQRPIYVRTDTIAVHETTYSQQFGTRRDSYGSGTEHFIGTRYPSLRPFTHVLVNGPGLPSNGIVFFVLDGAYLYTTSTLLAIRQAALNASTNPNWKLPLVRAVRDTRAYMMTDAQIKAINDAYYDSALNNYVYRFFADYADLYPSLTLVDTLPKRPYLSAELPVEYFPSVGINIDALVTSLQTFQPVTINWSLPLDLRGKPMLPDTVWFTRMNCLEAKAWPSCTDRAAQFNEYSLSPYFMSSSTQMTATLTPDPFPLDGLLTFKGFARVQLVDSLNRPIEARVGMDYTR